MNRLSNETFELRLKTIDSVYKLLKEAEFRYEKDALQYIVSKMKQAKTSKI